MTGLLKSGAGGSAHVRSAPFRVEASEQSSAVAAIPDPAAAYKAKIQRQGRDLAAAKIRIEELTSEIDEAHLRGLELGRAEGSAEAQDLQAERLAALSLGVDRALAGFEKQLGGLEELAGLLAQDSLFKVFGDQERQAELLGCAIREQLRGLARQSVIQIEAPRSEFSDPVKLAALTSTLDRPDVEICLRDDLAPGECQINLKLGALEVGLGQQWGRLSQALQSLAAVETSQEGVL